MLADEIVTEVAKQLADLFEEIKKDSVLPDGIPNIEVKAFYDILKSVAEQYGFLDEYTEEQYIALAKDVKEVVDDKTQYIDWDKKADIKAQLKVQIILTLAKHKYPPATRDEVFKAIFEQAENFKKNRNDSTHEVIRPYQVDEEYERIMVAEDYEFYQWKETNDEMSSVFGDNKTVLLGCYKNKKHLSWIQEQKIYNIRLGTRKGSKAGESELFERTSHLVLYDVDHPYKQLFFNIESCAEMSGEQLKEVGYPKEKPGKIYMTFKLVETSSNAHALYGPSLIEQISEEHPEHVKGTPVFLEL